MESNPVFGDQDKIVVEMEIFAPVERVFQAIVDPAQVRLWSDGPDYELIVCEIDPRVGGSWRSASRARAGKGDPAQVFDHRGKVLEIKPPNLFVYTWTANWHENPAHESVVRWELTPTAAGTKVKVTHSGLKDEQKALEGYSQGWPGLVQQIKTFLEKQGTSGN